MIRLYHAFIFPTVTVFILSFTLWYILIHTLIYSILLYYWIWDYYHEVMLFQSQTGDCSEQKICTLDLWYWKGEDSYSFLQVPLSLQPWLILFQETPVSYCTAQLQQLHVKALRSRARTDYKTFATSGPSQTNFFDLRLKHWSLHRMPISPLVVVQRHAFTTVDHALFSCSQKLDAFVVGAPWKRVWDNRRAVSIESA